MADELETIKTEPTNARDWYTLLLSIAKDVKQIQVVQGELTKLLRGEGGLNEGLLYEHQQIKSKIDYDNKDDIAIRVRQLESWFALGKWVIAIAGTSGIISAISFIWGLISHQTQIVTGAPVVLPTATAHPDYAGLVVILAWLLLGGGNAKRD